MVNRQRQYQLNHPEKHKARVKFGIAIKKGLIIRPDICSHCNETLKRIEGHHPDYAKPLEVIWVCPPCHSIIHPHGRTRVPSYHPCIQCGTQIGWKTKQIMCNSCRHRTLLSCHTCGKDFSLQTSDYTKRLKVRKALFLDKWFCSKQCSSAFMGRQYGWDYYRVNLAQ
jgi:DNA-directed RNA polymerase subunit RPC12/RpoP